MERRRGSIVGWIIGWIVAAGLVSGSVFGMRVLAQDQPASSEASVVTEMPRSAAMEAAYGIRVVRVSVIGGGGMVEMRYQLIDADLAEVIHEEDVDVDADFPRIEAGGLILAIPTFHHHGGDLVTGREFSILYPNSDGVVHAGAVVTVAIGDIRLEGIVVS